MSIFIWDSFSDQPHQIRDRKEKKRLKQKNRFQIWKTIFLSILLFPIFVFSLIFPIRKKEVDISNFFGIGINLDKGEKQIEFLEELNLKNITIRFPLSEIEDIEKYLTFLKQFRKYNILLNILQNRENIENHQLFRKNIFTIFQKFSEIGINEFQIGNAINRSKWGFFSIDEYLQFYKIAFEIRNSDFPQIKLVGSSVIDFEYYNTIHTIYNFYKIKFDTVSALLYVDRRGAPENKQSIIFNLEKKIKLLFQISRISSPNIYITETNYPIQNTEPYTPTSQFETVSLEEYKIFMVRYFLIALSTQLVQKVFWHQMVSAGYGLIDNRNEKLKKYPAFNSFKFLLKVLDGQKYISHKFSKNLHSVKFSEVEFFWTVSDEVEINFEKQEVFDIDGKKLNNGKIQVSKSPIIVFENII